MPEIRTFGTGLRLPTEKERRETKVREVEDRFWKMVMGKGGATCKLRSYERYRSDSKRILLQAVRS